VRGPIGISCPRRVRRLRVGRAIQNFAYNPTPLNVTTNTSVTRTNMDTSPHSVTSDANPPVFDSSPTNCGPAGGTGRIQHLDRADLGWMRDPVGLDPGSARARRRFYSNGWGWYATLSCSAATRRRTTMKVAMHAQKVLSEEIARSLARCPPKGQRAGVAAIREGTMSSSCPARFSVRLLAAATACAAVTLPATGTSARAEEPPFRASTP
jgi:hypothetical protein